MAALAMCVALPVAEGAAAKRGYGSRALAEPMQGRDVRMLQRLLTRWGLATPADGAYGAYTARRVRTWERDTGRRPNGAMSRAEQARLRADVQAGRRRPDTPPAPPAPTEIGPAGTATIGADGLAVAPASAPAAVKAIIAAGNAIHDKPYKYGGGHGRWKDTGYDCSGSMSYALHAAGLLETALDSTGFMRWGVAGRGRWVTTYGNPGHAYMVVAGLRFDTSGRARAGSRWHADMRSPRGYTVRHPAGL